MNCSCSGVVSGEWSTVLPEKALSLVNTSAQQRNPHSLDDDQKAAVDGLLSMDTWFCCKDLRPPLTRLGQLNRRGTSRSPWAIPGCTLTMWVHGKPRMLHLPTAVFDETKRCVYLFAAAAAAAAAAGFRRCLEVAVNRLHWGNLTMFHPLLFYNPRFGRAQISVGVNVRFRVCGRKCLFRYRGRELNLRPKIPK